MGLCRLAVLFSAATVFVTTTLPAADGSYTVDIQKWREQREARLKADDGWLTVSGLFWLKQGNNPAGSGPANSIVLPSAAPERVGIFVFGDGGTRFVAAPGVPVTAGGKPADTLSMRPDTDGSPDEISIGDLTMFVIERGGRYGIRLRDKGSKFRREFKGLHWFPPDVSYRVTARFVPYSAPRQIPIANVLGQTEQRNSPGYAVFRLHGKEWRLYPILEDGRLFFVFRDLTTGKETYPAGRFLYADMPKDGKVTLDFNKAYNPPCAFTPYATCPLPPVENHLKVRIPAGELTAKAH